MAQADNSDPPNLSELICRTVAYARRKLRAHPHLRVEPEDLAHDAYLHFHLHWDPHRGDAQAYLYFRVVHEIDRINRRRAIQNEILGEDENVVNLFEDPGASPDFAFHQKKLLDFIEARNPEAGILARWILFHDFTNSREIGQRMRVAPSHVDYLKRVLRKIMQEFEQTDAESSKTLPHRRSSTSTDGV